MPANVGVECVSRRRTSGNYTRIIRENAVKAGRRSGGSRRVQFATERDSVSEEGERGRGERGPAPVDVSLADKR